MIYEDASRARLLFARTLLVVGSSELVVLTFCFAPANFHQRTLHCLILNRSRSAVSVNYHALYACVNVIVLNFSFYRDAVNNDSCTSTGIECEENENNRNALTWGYSKKLPPNRKKSGKTLAKRPGRGIIAKPSDEGAPPTGRHRVGERPARRGAGPGRGNFLEKSP